MGVSILARPEGRALRIELVEAGLAELVSILARPEGRALQYRCIGNRGNGGFQSSPAPKDGRYAGRGNGRGANPAGFNPRPPRRTGATRRRSKTANSYRLFQSSPAPKDGRYDRLLLLHLRPFQVSILARPEGRALLFLSRNYLTMTLFQSSPAPKDGRYLLRYSQSIKKSPFQSSPAPKDGRYLGLGDVEDGPHQVSILARPEGRALRSASFPYPPVVSVSILARPEGRALPCYPLPV